MKIQPQQKCHVFYIFNGFPWISEMSTLNEVVGMIKRQYPITLFSLKDVDFQEIMHDFVLQYDLIAKTHYPGFSVVRDLKLLMFMIGSVKLIFSRFIPLRQKWAFWLFFLKKRNSRSLLNAFVNIVRLIHRNNPDILYCHFGNVGEVAIVLRRFITLPFVTFFHGYDFSRLPFEGRADFSELFRIGDLFIVNSRFARSKMMKIGCPETKISIIGGPIDSDKFQYTPRVPGKTVHLLTVARLVEKKGLAYSIEAVALIAKKHQNIRYTIIGDGPLKPDLENMIDRLRMKEYIYLAGVKTQEEIIQYMQSSHIFILSSVTARDGDTEGLPMALLEAQLTGMPVVTTMHSGCVDAIVDGSSGFLVPEKDFKTLAERISFLIEHPERWPEMGVCGRQHVLDNFAEDVYMSKLLGKLNDLCQQASR